MDEGTRIELVVRLWGTGAPDSLEEYVKVLVEDLLPRHKGREERRASQVDAGAGRPDTTLVLSFPDGPSVDGFLRDPLRADHEELAARAVSRAMIIDSRHRQPPEHDAQVVLLRHEPLEDD